MLLLKYLLPITGYGLLGWGVAISLKNLNKVVQYHLQLRRGVPGNHPEKPHLNWTTAKWALLVAWLPILLASGIVVVPSGMGGIRVSQTSGTRPGTLYPGVHFIVPLIDSVQLYDTRDQVLTTSTSKATADKKTEPFTVQSKEGLSMGLAITVRYKLDPKRLDFIHANLPQPVETEIVPPVVTSVFRELAPNYTVREVFATRREEIRATATQRITKKLGDDGIIVKEVMLRDIQLPEEYARGLEGLLLKEQQDEGLTVETDMKAKQVKIAELEAEAAKVQQVKQAEGAAQVHVLQAKSDSDAMQYLLPLKQKQIEQSKLEAEARKEATVKNAEAQAARIRKIAAADSERMQSEAVLLKQNPLLINKIIAERLSDKLQIMMVPSDAKIFFNDVMKGGINPEIMNRAAQADGEGDNAQGGDDAADESATQPQSQPQSLGRKTMRNRR